MSQVPYKEWLETSIYNGSIFCCPESDIKLGDKPIGFGASGAVYRGTVSLRNRFSLIPKAIQSKKQNVLSSGTIVAVKTLSPDNQYDCGEDLYQQFVKELKRHDEANDHPNIVRFYGLYRDKYHLIFSLAESGRLNEYLKKKMTCLIWEDRYQLSLGITDGLNHLHKLDIVHKNLSSNKILIDSQGNAKITDFGLSRVLKQAISNSSGDDDALAYKDPASFKNTSYQLGKQSDIFSLGVILWEVSSGKVPCGGHTEDVDIIAYRRKGFRDPSFPGTPKEYIDLYSECWHEDPDNRPFCESVYERLKSCDPLDHFNRSLEEKPDDAWALVKRGRIYESRKQYSYSLKDFDKSLKIKPNYVWALENRGYVYICLKKYNKALNDFSKVVEIEPNNVFGLSRRGSVYSSLRKYDNALRDLNKSLELKPNDAYSLNRRGYVYLMLKQYGNALLDFNKSLKIAPDSAWVLKSRGYVYLESKQYDSSLNDFNKALEVKPDDAYALRQRKFVYAKLNKLKTPLDSKPDDLNPSSTKEKVYDMHRDMEGSADELEDD